MLPTAIKASEQHVILLLYITSKECSSLQRAGCMPCCCTILFSCLSRPSMILIDHVIISYCIAAFLPSTAIRVLLDFWYITPYFWLGIQQYTRTAAVTYIRMIRYTVDYVWNVGPLSVRSFRCIACVNFTASNSSSIVRGTPTHTLTTLLLYK